MPTVTEDESVDLRAYFHRNHGWFYGLMIATTLVGVAVRSVPALALLAVIVIDGALISIDLT